MAWGRRLLFMAVCVALPVLANGVRAWGTVALAQVWGISWARGFDHIVYGWVFFGLVIGGTLLAFWRWFDRAADAPMIDGGALAASARLTRLERQALSPLVAVLAAGALVAGPMVWVGRVGSGWMPPGRHQHKHGNRWRMALWHGYWAAIKMRKGPRWMCLSPCMTGRGLAARQRLWVRGPCPRSRAGRGRGRGRGRGQWWQMPSATE